MGRTVNHLAIGTVNCPRGGGGDGCAANHQPSASSLDSVSPWRWMYVSVCHARWRAVVSTKIIPCVRWVSVVLLRLLGFQTDASFAWKTLLRTAERRLIRWRTRLRLASWRSPKTLSRRPAARRLRDAVAEPGRPAHRSRRAHRPRTPPEATRLSTRTFALRRRAAAPRAVDPGGHLLHQHARDRQDGRARLRRPRPIAGALVPPTLRKNCAAQRQKFSRRRRARPHPRPSSPQSRCRAPSTF